MGARWGGRAGPDADGDEAVPPEAVEPGPDIAEGVLDAGTGDLPVLADAPAGDTPTGTDRGGVVDPGGAPDPGPADPGAADDPGPPVAPRSAQGCAAGEAAGPAPFPGIAPQGRDEMGDLRYERPGTVAEAAALLAAGGGRARVLAGGTDLVLALRGGLPCDVLVDVKRIPELGRVVWTPHFYTDIYPFVGFNQPPRDFQVEELLGFEPTGAGEHAFLRTGITAEDYRQAHVAVGSRPAEHVGVDRGDGGGGKTEQEPIEGQVVQPADALFTVADLSHVWLVAEVPEQQAVLVLCDLEGMAYHEAASMTGSNLGTVKSRLSRARAKMRDALARNGFVPPISARGGGRLSAGRETAIRKVLMIK